MARRTRKTASAAAHATEIMALSPFVIGRRMAQMAQETPVGAAMSMHAFAMEKGLAAMEAGTAVWMEMARRSIDAGFGIHSSAENTAEAFAKAALTPVRKRVRANHKSKGIRRK